MAKREREREREEWKVGERSLKGRGSSVLARLAGGGAAESAVARMFGRCVRTR